MRIALYGRKIGDKHQEFVKHFVSKMEEKPDTFVVYEPFIKFINESFNINTTLKSFSKKSNLKNVDILITLGGDGTLLDAVALTHKYDIPILGINTGRLGFLSSIGTASIDNILETLFAKEFTLDKRTTLSATSNNSWLEKNGNALNEVTLQKRDTSSMITIQAYLDEEYLTTYWADGLIIATPTGSTAYSLSCNGPIILPQSDNFVITPIAPHNLSVRPIVIPDNKTMTFIIESRSPNFLISVDSRSKSISSDLKITVKKSKRHVNLIRLKNYSLLENLRSKLLWGKDSRAIFNTNIWRG